MTEAQVATEAIAARSASPSPSVSSVASSRSSGTLSRPPPPPKPSHLSSTFTGTVNSLALREYIQAQRTGGSFSAESSTGTVSRAFAGYGYGSVDHFVDAFDSSDDDDDDGGGKAGRIASIVAAGSGSDTARPTMRSRTHTAPSVSRIFSPSAEDDAGDGTTKLIRKEPIQIDGKGPSRVGNLRNMFEAPKEVQPLSPQRTGTGTVSRAQPKKVSQKTRRLQAQITGERGVWSFGPSSVDPPSHQSQDSDSNIMYATAKEDQIKQELSRLSSVEDEPELGGGTIRLSVGKREGSPIHQAPPAAALPLRSSPGVHDRDDSSATIRPRNVSPQLGTARRMPSTMGRSSDPRRRSRLSSVFSAGSTGTGGARDPSDTPSPDGKSVSGSEYAETDAGRNERSREPSMLIDQGTKTSAHMRAHDGSSFDFDWVNAVGSLADMRQAAAAATVTPEKLNWTSQEHSSPSPRSRKSSAFFDKSIAPIAVRAGPPPQRPESIVLNLEMQVEPVPESVDSCIAQGGLETMTVAEAHRNASQEGDAAPPAATEMSSAAPLRVPQPGIGRQARALYDFLGEVSFNELTLRAGQSFEIVNEELAGGWSLGIVWDDDGLPRRGLVPRGWYCYIQDFTMSPPPAQGVEPPPTPSPFPEEGDESQTLDNASAPVPSIQLPAPAEYYDATDARTSPKGSRAMSRIGSIGAGNEPLVGLSAAKASGGTWKRSSMASSREPAQALDRLSSVAADHGVPTVPQQRVDRQSNDVHMSKRMTEGHGIETAARDSADSSMDLSYATTRGASGSFERTPSRTYPASSTPSRPHATQAVAPAVSVVEPPAASAMFGWRTSIFGGKTLNRFASFVTSGAEEYILSKDSGSVDSGPLRAAARMAPSFSSASGTSGSTVPTLLEEGDEVEDDDEAGGSAVRAREASGSRSSGHSVRSEEADQHYVVAGRAGPRWRAKTPPFLVQVHSPEKRTKMSGMHEYTVFCVTSTFPAPIHPSDRSQFGAPQGSVRGGGDDSEDDDDDDDEGPVKMPYDPLAAPEPPGPSLTVLRRFTQFAWLYQTLTKLYPPLVLPPLPEKQYSGRFAAEFIETRRADLELWISRIVRHPVLRYSEAVLFFLSCEDEIEWKRQAGRLLRGESRDSHGSSSRARVKGNMFARTWHPDFNFDATEAALEGEAADAHMKAMERTMNGVGGPNVGRQGVLGAWKGLREGAVATSACYRDLSYSLLRLITGTGVVGPNETSHGSDTSGDGANGGSASDYAHYIHGPPMGNLGKRSETGATNEHGVWCWREGCHECTNLTYVLQNTAEALQDVADLYEEHARETLLRQHERLKDVSRPHTAHQSLLETHRATLAKYREATGEPDPLRPAAVDNADDDDVQNSDAPALPAADAERIAARCETVLNVTLAEMDRVHDERVEDLHSIGKRFLDSQIEAYESILETLKGARAHYDEEYYDCERGIHILPSRYQAELVRPRKPERALAMPSAALGGVGGLGRMGMLLSTAAGMTRPVSNGFVNGGAAGDLSTGFAAAERETVTGAGAGGSFFLHPNSHLPNGVHSPGEGRWSPGGHPGGATAAVATLKASQWQASQGQQPTGAGSRTSYFSLWR